MGYTGIFNIYPKLIVFTPNLQFSPYSKVIYTWQYKIQANERSTKINKKWLTIQCDVSDLSFIFFIPTSQTISVINRSDACHFSDASTSGAGAGLCACNRIHQLEKTVVDRCGWSALLLGWNLLYIVSIFLILLAICSSRSLDHPENAAEYPTTYTAQVSMALKTCPVFNFVPNTFLTLL